MTPPNSPASPPGAPLLPFGWRWMQLALLVSGVAGIAAGLWKSTWFADDVKNPATAPAEVRQWIETKVRFKESWRETMKWTNVAQFALASALVVGGLLMQGRFAGLRYSMLAVSWFGILFAVVGTTLTVWYLATWSNWAGEIPPAAATTAGIDLPSAAAGWSITLALALLGLGKLVFFIVAVGYFGRFDVRAYLEDPPEWFYATRTSAVS